MNTPIWDFVCQYRESNALRLHMPGHKGRGPLGVEGLDITEINGADSLFEACGIIAESEKNASRLFGCPTFYSTEGSSLAIRAMLHLACLHARGQGKTPRVAAGRNAHKTFLSAAALLDFEVDWLIPPTDSYLACPITADFLENHLSANPETTAVFVTSPDYAGNLLPIADLSRVCHRHGCLLLVDCAHGAYLKFLSPSVHPMDLGADLCCASAHKTLPVLTGGAYLHLSANLPSSLLESAKDALSLFASTSPSFLILQSLDLANKALAEGYGEAIRRLAFDAEEGERDLRGQGFDLRGSEPLKWTIYPKSYGYLGTDLAHYLESEGIVCEFADPDLTVLMLSPSLTSKELERVKRVLCRLPEQREILTPPPFPAVRERVMSPREAMLSPGEVLPIEDCVGRVLASPSVGCPPAVPLLVCGERIREEHMSIFRYYNISTLRVVSKKGEIS